MKFLGCAVQLLWLIFIVPDFVASAMLPPYNFALLSHSARRVRNPLLRSKLALLGSVESGVKYFFLIQITKSTHADTTSDEDLQITKGILSLQI